ncbi:MAG: glycosyltransferase family 9 protein [Melioribacteraceae bacterium]
MLIVNKIKYPVKRILIIKLKGIGDVILASLIIKPIQDYYPEAKIDFLADKSSFDLLKSIPLINYIIKNGKTFSERLKTILKIRSHKYDIVLDLYSNSTTALYTFFSGAKIRVGFPYKGRKYAYNIYGPCERDKYHNAELQLKLIENLGILVKEKSFPININEDDRNYADKFINNYDEKVYIGISLTGGWNSKKCPPEKYAEIINELAKKYLFTPLILWGPGDEKEADKLKSLLTNSVKIPNCTFMQMGAIMRKCKFILCNDSGPMHLAAALNIPLLAFFGPTNPKFHAPYNENSLVINYPELHCIVCNLLECPYKHECFYELPIQRILNQIDKLIIQNKISPNEKY